MICPMCGQEGGNGGKCLICGYAFSNESEGNNKISKLSICPVCGSELQTGISTCPICGAGIDLNVEANVSDSTLKVESNIKAVNNSGNNKKNIYSYMSHCYYWRWWFLWLQVCSSKR